MDAVLSSVQLPVPVRAYRGVSVYDSARWINAKPGDIQEIDTFSSLSLDEKIADHFATLPDSDNNYGKPVDGGVLLEIELPAGTPGIYIPGLASWNDNRINRNVREKELLIPRNVIFEVVSRERVSSERAPSGELVKVKVRLTGFSQNKEVPRRSTDLFKEQAEKRIQELVNDNSVQAVLGIDAPDTLRATIEKMMEKGKRWKDGFKASSYRYVTGDDEEKIGQLSAITRAQYACLGGLIEAIRNGDKLPPMARGEDIAYHSYHFASEAIGETAAEIKDPLQTALDAVRKLVGDFPEDDRSRVDETVRRSSVWKRDDFSNRGKAVFALMEGLRASGVEIGTMKNIPSDNFRFSKWLGFYQQYYPNMQWVKSVGASWGERPSSKSKRLAVCIPNSISAKEMVIIRCTIASSAMQRKSGKQMKPDMEKMLFILVV